MPASFEVLPPADVVRIVLTDPFEVVDALAAFEKVTQHAHTQPGKVFTVIDGSQLKTAGLPKGAMQIRTAEIFKAQDKYVLIIVQASQMGKLFGEMLMRITGQTNIRFAATPEAAFALIASLRTTI
jgi:hypothetical protein